jgi:hypothetical protein
VRDSLEIDGSELIRTTRMIRRVVEERYARE